MKREKDMVLLLHFHFYNYTCIKHHRVLHARGLEFSDLAESTSDYVCDLWKRSRSYTPNGLRSLPKKSLWKKRTCQIQHWIYALDLWVKKKLHLYTLDLYTLTFICIQHILPYRDAIAIYAKINFLK